MNFGCYCPAEEELRARVEALMAQLAKHESEKERLHSENRELSTRLAEEEQATNRSGGPHSISSFIAKQEGDIFLLL